MNSEEEQADIAKGIKVFTDVVYLLPSLILCLLFCVVATVVGYIIAVRLNSEGTVLQP